MGALLGITESEAQAETEVLENICLYCDSFFSRFVDPNTLATKLPQQIAKL